jgi:large subunit ribosomal protein LP2
LHNVAADDVAKLLKDTGVQTNKEELDAMIKALSGKKLHDLVRDGSKRLASVPSGGVAAAPAKAAAAGAPAQAAAPAKKEEKPKEEEADVDMGGLFGDDY